MPIGYWVDELLLWKGVLSSTDASFSNGGVDCTLEMHQVRDFLAVDRKWRSCAQPKSATFRSPLSHVQFSRWKTGGPLFHRERHLTHPAELGEMVRPHLETVYEAAVKAKRLSQDLSQQKRVPLKLGIISTISPDEIVDLIAALKERRDGLELRLCDANAKDLRNRLLAGDLEVASMHYRAKNSTSAPTLCRCFASRWLSR